MLSDGGQSISTKSYWSSTADSAVFRRRSRRSRSTSSTSAPATFAVGADQVVSDLVIAMAGFGDGRVLEQNVVDRQFQFSLVDARAHRGIALWVQIDHQHPLTHLGQARRQVDGGRGLADPALLVGYAEDTGHVDAKEECGDQRSTVGSAPLHAGPGRCHATAAARPFARRQHVNSRLRPRCGWLGASRRGSARHPALERPAVPRETHRWWQATAPIHLAAPCPSWPPKRPLAQVRQRSGERNQPGWRRLAR